MSKSFNMMLPLMAMLMKSNMNSRSTGQKFTPSNVRSYQRSNYPVKKYSARKYTKGYKKKYVSRKKKPMTISRKLQQVSKTVSATLALVIRRNRITDRCLALSNQQFFQGQNISSIGIIESAISNLQYYDPSDPANLISVVGAVGTFKRIYLFKRVVTKITVRNNYQTPAFVSVYACAVKSDTDETPSTAFTNGMLDVGNPSTTSPLTYLTDSNQFNFLWKIKKSKKIILNAGEQCSLFYDIGEFTYDPSISDTHNLQYQVKNKGFVWMVFCSGVIGHDGTEANDFQGTLASGVDIMSDTTFEIEYDAGVKIKQIQINDVSDTMTLPIISNKPSNSNQSFKSS